MHDVCSCLQGINQIFRCQLSVRSVLSNEEPVMAHGTATLAAIRWCYVFVGEDEWKGVLIAVTELTFCMMDGIEVQSNSSNE